MTIDQLNVINNNKILITDKHVFFWDGTFSNWFPCKLKYSYFDDIHEFFCTEQAFMWHKAKYFNDSKIADAILNEKSNPRICKDLGRKVMNYDDEAWNKIRYSVMYSVNLMKWTQNEDLKEFIMQDKFNDKLFVEASPFDGIWGIKMKIGMSGIDDENNWKGQNLLGQVITEIRNYIKEKL